MNVLIIPEDCPNDQYILRPILARLFRSIGVPSAKIQVCQNPRLRGVDRALNSGEIRKIVDQYRGMTDLFILCVDRDGEANRKDRLAQLENEFTSIRTFVAVNAWQEIEAWVLAAMTDLPSNWTWSTVRCERDVKEVYFDPYVEQRGLSSTPGNGRKILGKEASRSINAIRGKCPDDFDCLAKRLSKVATG